MPQIESEDLRAKDIPPADSGWGDLSEFALTFNGYTHWGSDELCEQVASERRHETLDELRTCLFYEERSSRLSDADDDQSLALMRELVEMIREKVNARDSA